MSQAQFPQSKLGDLVLTSSIESGSSNEYSTESPCTLKLSSIKKGSELYINDFSDVDSLPIDFSRLKITTDSNGQLSVADKEQLRQIEQVVDIYFASPANPLSKQSQGRNLLNGSSLTT